MRWLHTVVSSLCCCVVAVLADVASSCGKTGICEDFVTAADRMEGALFHDEDRESLRLLQIGGRAVRGEAGISADSSHALKMEVADNATDRTSWADTRCLKGVEGENCVPGDGDPKQNRSLWTHITYCSGAPGVRYRLWQGDQSCESLKGHLSRCKMVGSGLSMAQCDDPFCRTRQDGRYCYQGRIVMCQGDAEPQVVDQCSSQYENQNFMADDEQGESVNVECTKTRQFSCQGAFPDPFCGPSGTSSRCDIRRRSNPRRRCDDGRRRDDFDGRRRDDGRRRFNW